MPESFQSKVAPWMEECFGSEISADKIERGCRFLEESLELGQSLGLPEEGAIKLVRYTYNRPVGDLVNEVGGVMVTLAALCLACNIDMQRAGDIELARICIPEIMQKIRDKQATKPSNSPLPEKVQVPSTEDQKTIAFEMLKSWPHWKREAVRVAANTWKDDDEAALAHELGLG